MGEKIIGIIGGMGPEATLDLYKRILRYTSARRDQDHYRTIIDSNPKIPDRTAAILDGGEDPVPLLVATARNLEKAGADFLIMPCNTAHFYIGQLRSSVSIPVISMVHEAITDLKRQVPDASVVGLMGTTATARTPLYVRPLRDVDVEVVVPNDRSQESLMATLYAIKAGQKGSSVRKALEIVASELIAEGAQALLLACTEIPLLLTADHVDVPVVDTLDVLARAAVREARGDGGL